MKTLKQIYEEDLVYIPGNNDKGTDHTYIELYEDLFRPFRDKPINFLEIGIARGHSLIMWSNYFNEKARIIGYDIEHTNLLSNDLEVYYGDSTKGSGIPDIESFDIIVDDGDHTPEGQLATATHWLSRVSNNGLYIIEDIYSADVQKYKNLINRLNIPHSIIYVIDLRINKSRHDDIMIVIRVIK